LSKTADLKKLITTQLGTVTGGTYYRKAIDNASFPYKVFSFRSVDLSDIARDDVLLTVDIYDQDTNQKAIESMADSIEALFNAKNLPQTNILPTIYRNSRLYIDSDDYNIQHIELTFYIQSYEK
jgi:hypothetical protein